MVILRIQLCQMAKLVHDCHHDEHSPHAVGLMCVMLLDEWFKAWLGFFA
jgi:hypothetical protein